MANGMIARSLSFSETVPDSPTSSEEEMPRYSSLRNWLRARGLGEYFEPLRDLGAKRVSDLALLTEDDLKDLDLDEKQQKTLAVVVI